MNHLDLFTGIGGFHLAAEWAGFQTIGFAEVEPYCCKLLAQKWSAIKNYGDIRRADFSGLRGSVDILSAGVPCQPASLAGKRRGAGDDRWLWPATLDVVGAVEPAWAIFENPPGILSLGEFGGILSSLDAHGYNVRAFCVPANSVGAKHLRARVFIVANAEKRGIRRGETQRKSGQLTFASERAEALADADGAQRWQAQPGRHEHHGQETGRGQNPDRPAGVRDQIAADADQFNGDHAGSRAGETSPQDRRSILAVPGFRLTQPPLCRRADGIPDRSHRLRALGNAVVPQQAYPFFAAIAQTEIELSLGELR